MDEPLKKRLLGAIVLVALGVIFIPALLDNRGDDRLTVKMEIPEKPAEFDMEQALETLRDQKAELAKLDLPPPLDRPPKSNQSSGNTTQQEIANSATEAQQTIGKKVVKPSVNHQKTVNTTQPELTQQTTDNVGSQTAAPQWILQLGSFGQESNADRLVNKLRKANWKAYKESVQGAAGTVYRVRLGPIDQRERAENYRQQLLDLGYQHTIIMGYP